MDHVNEAGFKAAPAPCAQLVVDNDLVQMRSLPFCISGTAIIEKVPSKCIGGDYNFHGPFYLLFRAICSTISYAINSNTQKEAASSARRAGSSRETPKIRPERNISKLLDYARQLRVGTILENYLQVKL